MSLLSCYNTLNRTGSNIYSLNEADKPLNCHFSLKGRPFIWFPVSSCKNAIFRIKGPALFTGEPGYDKSRIKGLCTNYLTLREGEGSGRLATHSFRKIDICVLQHYMGVILGKSELTPRLR